MPFAVTMLLSVLKKIFFKIAGEKLFTWMLFWGAELLAASTETKHDDTLVAKIKEAYYVKGETRK